MSNYEDKLATLQHVKNALEPNLPEGTELIKPARLLGAHIQVLRENLYHFYINGIEPKSINTIGSWDPDTDEYFVLHTLNADVETLEDIEALVYNEAVYDIHVFIEDPIINMGRLMTAALKKFSEDRNNE